MNYPPPEFLRMHLKSELAENYFLNYVEICGGYRIYVFLKITVQDTSFDLCEFMIQIESIFFSFNPQKQVIHFIAYLAWYNLPKDNIFTCYAGFRVTVGMLLSCYV